MTNKGSLVGGLREITLPSTEEGYPLSGGESTSGTGSAGEVGSSPTLPAYTACDDYDSHMEDAWQRQQESLMEDGGPDDSSYRQDLINAGRGHLLPR
jgi:hypothetical protein